MPSRTFSIMALAVVLAGPASTAGCAGDERRHTHRLDVNFAPHGHAFTPDDWTALIDFFDTHPRGKPIARPVDAADGDNLPDRVDDGPGCLHRDAVAAVRNQHLASAT